MKTVKKYLKEAKHFNSTNIVAQIENLYNIWGGEVLEMSDVGKSVSKVQGHLAKADKAYKEFLKQMNAAEKLAKKG